MHLWRWLNQNSGALQSIAAFLIAVLTIITIRVLWATWGAIKQQATAADALTKVADAQTKAAENAAKSAQRQAELLASQIELDTAPLLVAEPDLGQAIPAYRNYKIVNRGQGVAFQVYFWAGELEAKNAMGISITAVQPSTLAPNASTSVAIKDQWEAWTIRYKGIDRCERWTIVHKDPVKGQQHVVQKGLQEVYLA